MIEHEIRELLQAEETDERNELLFAASAESAVLMKQIKDFSKPIVWRGSRRGSIAYIHQKERQGRLLLQKDRTLRDKIAAYKQLTTELITLQFRAPRDTRGADALNGRIKLAKEEIARFAAPSAADEGADVDVPSEIAEPFDMVVRYYVDLANNRVRLMSTASAQQLLEMDGGAVGLDNMLKEHLSELKDACEYSDEDTEAGPALDDLWIDEAYNRVRLTSAQQLLDRSNRYGGGVGLADEDTEAGAATLQNMRSSLDLINRDIAKNEKEQLDLQRQIDGKNEPHIDPKRRQQLNVAMKIEQRLKDKITRLVDKLTEKQNSLIGLTDDEYDRLHRDEVRALTEELQMATKQYGSNLAAHREKNEAAAGGRAAGS